MPTPKTPANEFLRLRALHECNILDTEPEAAFDDITMLAARLCDVPVALITLLAASRQWCKSAVGTTVRETTRDVAICNHAIVADGPLQIVDLLTDPRTADNPDVIEGPQYRFYAGVPLRSEEGLILGTLCVIDYRGRQLTHDQFSNLQALARQAATQLELRRKNHVIVAARDLLQRTGDLARVGGWELDVLTEKLTWTDAVYRIHELSPCEEITVAKAISFYAPDAREIIHDAVARGMKTGEGWDLELPFISGRGRHAWVRAQGEPVFVDGKVVKLRGVFQDVTERHKLEDELRAAARTDKLTGLPNRSLLHEQLQRAVVQARENSDYHFAVFFLDFDRFKAVNDTLGHDVGDQLLKAIARRLTDTVRDSDAVTSPGANTTSRLGGDEFVILLNGLTAARDATIVAARLEAALEKPYQLGPHEVWSTASIGIVTSDALSDTTINGAEAILRDADTAMYEAKQAGRGRHALFDVSMRERVHRRLSLENDLRRALDARQLTLVYQPIISLATGEVESLEALLRWKHPERGVIKPEEFVPIAEDTGQIVTIGEWALRQSCRDYAMWRTRMGNTAPKSISVNLSRNQLLMPNLPALVAQILQETRVDPARLHLEITESTVMRDVDHAVGVLNALRAIGVRIDMDDFGTGHSSLACLQKFPIDVLKIDQSFIANIDRGHGFAALVQAVAQLARNLDISVVAEGIETAEQVIILQALDCDFGQGFLFSKPVPADAVPTLRIHMNALAGRAA